MKRRNTQEIARAEIMFLDKLLPNVGENAERFLADPFGYTICSMKNGKKAEKNNTYWCYDCGAEFPLSEIKDYRENPEYTAYKNNKKKFRWDYWYGWKHFGTCPHCGKPLKIDDFACNKRTLKDEVCFTATMGDWKITRYFSETCHCKPGRKQEVLLEDIGATWQRDGKTYHYISRKGGMFYGKWWKSDTRHFAQDGISAGAGEVEEHYDMPDFSIETELAKRGIDLDNLHGLKLTQILSYMENPHFETLWKQGEWEMAKFFRNDLERYWAEIRIARKHGYKIEDLTEWRDMVNILFYLGKDAHNPKFICPDNLRDAHNALLAEQTREINRIREIARRRQDEINRIEAEKALKNAEKEESAFIKRRERFFDLSIETDNYTIVCLKSIKEFKQEGDTLHHCVFRAGYYRFADSLILSARDADNNPIETLEINLRGMYVVQCRADHDGCSKYHDDIIKTIKDNMWQIKERYNGKKKAVAA